LHFEDSPDDEKDQHMPVIEVRFRLEKETNGALRYQEVDEKGELIEQAWAKIDSTSAQERIRARR
jgi:hypothetical protein